MNSNIHRPKDDINQINIFNNFNFDDKPFDNPLENICFFYYLLNLSNQSYDFTRLHYDVSYLQNAYNEYLLMI